MKALTGTYCCPTSVLDDVNCVEMCADGDSRTNDLLGCLMCVMCFCVRMMMTFSAAIVCGYCCCVCVCRRVCMCVCLFDCFF